jgi:hypothetical protein
LGCNLFGNLSGGGAVWIYWHCCGRGGNREVSLPSLPCDLPDFFNYRHLGRQKDPVITTALMTAPEWWTRAAREDDPNGDDALRSLAI